MSLQIGIVGLPNAGKSTLFNALTRAAAAVAPYPFTTIDPNVGVAAVPDGRLDALAALVRPERVVPATVDFVDIAGLVKGASQGLGLGNQFLGHIRNVDAVALVLRAFEDPDIPPAGERVDPLADLDTLDLELILADVTTADRRIEKVQGQAKAHPRDFAEQLAWLAGLREHLNGGQPAYRFEAAAHAEWTADLNLLSAKPRLFVVNVAEEDLPEGGPAAAAVIERAGQEGAPCLVLCASSEAELATWPPDEAAGYRAELGLAEPGLEPPDRGRLPAARPDHLLHHHRGQGSARLDAAPRGDGLRGGRADPHRHPAGVYPRRGGAPAGDRGGGRAGRGTCRRADAPGGAGLRRAGRRRHSLPIQCLGRSVCHRTGACGIVCKPREGTRPRSFCPRRKDQALWTGGKPVERRHKSAAWPNTCMITKW